MQANQRVSPPLHSQSTGSTVCDASAATIYLAQAARSDDRGLKIGGRPANVGHYQCPPTEHIVLADSSCLMHQQGRAESIGVPIKFIQIAQILNGAST
jgi:hypothetical protein